MILAENITMIFIIVIASFLGALIKDIYNTLIDKESIMNYKKIIVSWITAVAFSFALFSINYIQSFDEFKMFALSFIFGAFGYTIFEFFMSEKGKKILLKLFLKKLSESTEIVLKELQEKKEE